MVKLIRRLVGALPAGLSLIPLIIIGSGWAKSPPIPAFGSGSGSDSAQISGSPALSPADSLLQKAVAYHREAQDLTLAFKAKTYQAAVDKEAEYSGTLRLKGAGKFRLEIPGTRIVSDGKTVWEHHEANKQVLIKSLDHWDSGALPAEALLRFLDARPLSHEEVREGKTRLHKLQLDPTGKVKNLRSLTVYLRADTHKVHKIETVDLSENTAEYRLTRVEAGTGLKDKLFTYAVPKGVEAVDMRD